MAKYSSIVSKTIYSLFVFFKKNTWILYCINIYSVAVILHDTFNNITISFLPKILK